jgi:hypothetical protein
MYYRALVHISQPLAAAVITSNSSNSSQLSNAHTNKFSFTRNSGAPSFVVPHVSTHILYITEPITACAFVTQHQLLLQYSPHFDIPYNSGAYSKAARV